jgi:anti-sigma regulatory factor (Ser/Thr protein kinase)
MSGDERVSQGREDPLLLQRRLPADEDAPGTARALVQEVLIGLDGQVGGRRDDVILVVSELVSNAVVHGPPGEIELRVEIDGALVRVEVADEGSIPFGWPDTFGAGGHWGLSLVLRLSDRAGIESGPTTCAWCEIDLEA